MKKTKKIKTMNLILILVGLSALIFTLVMIVLFIKFGSIPDMLCERFYTCVVGECGVMGVMQIVKIRYQKTDASDASENTEEITEESEG